MAIDDRETIASIRSKYEGTAAEHDLLRRLVEDGEKNFKWNFGQVEEELRVQQDDLAKQQRAVSDMQNGMLIDNSVYWLLRSGPHGAEDTINWRVSEVIGAMRGRGLTREHLETFLEDWPAEETVDTE